MYLYRAVDKNSNSIDFLLTKRSNKSAAHLFLLKAINNNGKPLTINTLISVVQTSKLLELTTKEHGSK